MFLLLEHCLKGAGRENQDVYANRQGRAGFTATVSTERVAMAFGARVFLRPLHGRGMENRGGKTMRTHRQTCHICLTYQHRVVQNSTCRKTSTKDTGAKALPCFLDIRSLFRVIRCRLKI